MTTLDKRLQRAWAALSAAADGSDREFWETFDRLEAETLDGLQGQEQIRATQTLHAYLANLKGFSGPSKRPGRA